MISLYHVIEKFIARNNSFYFSWIIQMLYLLRYLFLIVVEENKLIVYADHLFLSHRYIRILSQMRSLITYYSAIAHEKSCNTFQLKGISLFHNIRKTEIDVTQDSLFSHISIDHTTIVSFLK